MPIQTDGGVVGREVLLVPGVPPMCSPAPSPALVVPGLGTGTLRHDP